MEARKDAWENVGAPDLDVGFHEDRAISYHTMVPVRLEVLDTEGLEFNSRPWYK